MCIRDRRWYSQPGTPTVSVETGYDNGMLTLDFVQSNPKSNGEPQIIPITYGVLGPDGGEVLDTQLCVLKQQRERLTIPAPEGSVPSILRGFSAPVVLNHTADHAFLLAQDTDPFNRWEAARSLARTSLINSVIKGSQPEAAWLDGVAKVMTDETLDPAFRALILGLPGQSELAAELQRTGHIPDPDAIWSAVNALKQALSDRLKDALGPLYAAQQIDGAYEPDAAQAGKRALGNAVLSLLTRQDGGAQAQAQFDAANNMTQQLSALANLIRAGRGDAALSQFEAQWHNDRLVMDKWFGLQVIEAKPDDAVDTAKALTRHAAFNWKNPNRFRATLGALAGHHAGFHAKDGSGYTLLADWLIQLDPVNPQTTARMCSAFQTWRRYDAIRQSMIGKELDRIAATPDLSRDTTEMITRIREA